MDPSRRDGLSVLDLNKDELLGIFAWINQMERCKTIPLACKAFARALKCSGDLYRQLDVDLGSMEVLITSPADEACAAMQLQDLLCWLQPRGPFARDLRVRLVGSWERLTGNTLTAALGHCSALERLHVTALSRINAWPPAIFNIAGLRELVLHASSTWARLPPELGQLVNLELLEIQMSIEGGLNVASGFLPLELLGCTRLREVSFLQCRAVELSPVLGELPSLTTLCVRDADLNTRNWGAIHPCTFHRGAWATVSLTFLQLDRCNLDVLPYQICHLGNLRGLSLAGNNLSDLPKLLATYLRALEALDLAGNAFARIPPVLALMPRLRTLDMSSNSRLQVAADSGGAQKSCYVGASVYRGQLSLMRLISSLPALRSLDLRKHPGALQQPPDST